MLLEALLGKPCSQRHPEVASGAQKQKFCLGCNFFAIRDCCNLPNRGLLPKNAAKMAVQRLIAALSGWRGVANRKKDAKSRDFCFRDGRITATGRICRKTRKVSNGNEGKCLKRRRGYDDSRANTVKRNKRKRHLGIAAAFCSGCIYANYGQDYRINGKGFAVFG